MSTTKQLTADGLFLAQIGLALIFGGSEFLRLLTSHEGVHLIWLASWLAFLLLNLALTIRAHASRASRVTLQAIGSYAVWTVVIAADLMVLSIKGANTWDASDTVTALIVGLGLALTLLAAYRLGWKITDPMVHGLFGVFFIAVPQVTLAYTIVAEGGGGLAGAALLASNFAILIRLGLLGFAIAEAGWDENRKGAAMSEFANEISWLLVTLAWLVRYPGS
jgi:hypothetical protein